MKRYLLVLTLCVVGSVVFETANQTVLSNAAGAVAGKSGSPADGETCSDGIGCHGGSPTAIFDVISSNVPVDGYIGGNTYTITASVTDSSRVKFGFEISPQDSAGNLLGSLTITDPTRTHFCPGGTKYITHSIMGTSAPSHTSTWQFDWTAPAAGTGCVTFYGAFNFTNNNALSSGDVIHTSSLTICENSVGINDPMVVSSLNVYPNPASDVLQLSYYLQHPEMVSVSLIDIQGRIVKELLHEQQSSGAQQFTTRLDAGYPAGIYLLQLKAGDQLITRKVTKL